MVKSRPACLLALFRAALLLVAFGLESKTGRTAASAAGGSRNARRPAVCGPGTEQPQCSGPAHGHGEGGAGGPANETPNAEAVCDSGECTNQQQLPPQPPPQYQQKQQEQLKPHNKPPQHHHRQQQRQQQRVAGTSAATVNRGSADIAPSRFQSGDIVELYNTESQDIQIVFPSLVRGHDELDGHYYYRVTKTTDGKEVENIPDRHVHPYVPYPQGGEALCNIGDFKPARPIVVLCTVLEYTPAATRGALVLQGRYRVRVAKTKVSEEYETELPVWKLQRRYQAVADM